MNKKQLATEIVYAQDKELDLTPEYWEDKISTILKQERQKTIDYLQKKIEDMPETFPELESDIYDIAYKDAKEHFQDIIKTLTKP